MINLGIVGLGPVWENRYRPVLEKFRHRIRIGAVFDAVANRCHQAAFDLGAVPYQGIMALLTESDVRGILILDTSWHGTALLHFIRKAKKPAYIAGSLGEDWDELSRLCSLVESEGLVIMPEFSRRFTPATCRLHELMATRLGRPRHISIDAVTPAADAPDAIPGQAAETDFLVGLLDWCLHVVRSSTVRLEARRLPAECAHKVTGRCIAIEFAEMRDSGRRTKAELRLEPAAARDPASDVSPLSFIVTCERGQAVIHGPTQIQWSMTGDEPVVESLTADRSEVEVMIDHFCRRLVGGLVPIADISDVCHCLRLVTAAAESLAAAGPVQLSGE
jgi:predicted dehydrogenase